MTRLIYTCLFALTFMVAACSPTPHGNVNHTAVIESVDMLPLRAAGVLVFREDRPFDTSAVNVYIDGDYFTSLQKDSYRYVDLCPGRHYIAAAVHHSDPGYYSKLKTDQPFELGKGEVAYLKIAGNTNGQVQFVSVTAQEAERVLGHLQLQDHTLSRVVSGSKCK